MVAHELRSVGRVLTRSKLRALVEAFMEFTANLLLLGNLSEQLGALVRRHFVLPRSRSRHVVGQAFGVEGLPKEVQPLWRELDAAIRATLYDTHHAAGEGARKPNAGKGCQMRTGNQCEHW